MISHGFSPQSLMRLWPFHRVLIISMSVLVLTLVALAVLIQVTHNDLQRLLRDSRALHIMSTLQTKLYETQVYVEAFGQLKQTDPNPPTEHIIRILGDLDGSYDRLKALHSDSAIYPFIAPLEELITNFHGAVKTATVSKSPAQDYDAEAVIIAELSRIPHAFHMLYQGQEMMDQRLATFTQRLRGLQLLMMLCMLAVISSGALLLRAFRQHARAGFQEAYTLLEVEGLERRQIEQTLKQQRARLQAIMDHAPAAITVQDLEGKYIMANKRALALQNALKEGEALGKTAFDIYSYALAEQLCRYDNVIIKYSKPKQYECTTFFDGRTRLVSKFPIADERGKTYALGSMITDVTSRKQAEEALQMLWEFAPDAIIVINTRTNLLEMPSANAERLLGLSRSQLTSVSPMDISAKEQPDYPAADQAMAQYLQQALKQNTPTFEWLFKQASGHLIPCEVRLACLPGERRHLVLARISDISTRKEVEAELTRYRDHLEEVVNQRTTELRDALQTLKAAQHDLVQSEKMAALGQLVAGVAHEINTPLAAISASASNINDALADTLHTLPPLLKAATPEQREMFFSLTKHALRLQAPLSSRDERHARRQMARYLAVAGLDNATTLAEQLVLMGFVEVEELEPYLTLVQTPLGKDLVMTAFAIVSQRRHSDTIAMAVERASKFVLALKRYTHRDHSQNRVPLDVREGIELTLTLYQSQLRQGIEVRCHFADIPVVMGCPDELNQVWTNLIQNALQAMNAQGVLTLRTFTQKQGDDVPYVIVTVEDTGGGVAPEIEAHIFEAFFTTKAAGEGSGLGLDIVRHIIEQHSGQITVQSSQGKTVFAVCLPSAETGALTTDALALGGGDAEEHVSSTPTPIVRA